MWVFLCFYLSMKLPVQKWLLSLSGSPLFPLPYLCLDLGGDTFGGVDRVCIILFHWCVWRWCTRYCSRLQLVHSGYLVHQLPCVVLGQFLHLEIDWGCSVSPVYAFSLVGSRTSQLVCFARVCQEMGWM